MFSFFRLTLLTAMAVAVSLSARADQIRYLSTGQVALSQMAATLLSAKKSIDMAYYIYDPCAPSTGILQRILVQKAREGISVRLLLDAEGFPPGLRRDVFATAMAGHKIQVRFYNKWTSRSNVLANNRLHAKLMLVDKRVYITGGRNISDDYFSLAQTINFVDRDVAVTGPSVGQASQGFQLLWNSRPVFSEARASAQEVALFQRSCEKHSEDKELEKEVLQNLEKTLAATQTFTCSNTHFSVDDPAFMDAASGGDGGEYLSGERLQLKHTTRAVLEQLENVKSSLDIENWSYIPSLRMMAALDKIRAANLPISIYTNRGVGKIDEMTYLQNYYLKQDQRGSQKNFGVSALGSMKDSWDMSFATAIYFVHSKVFVIDRRHAIVGSYNLDPRSYHTNIESAFIAKDCPELAKHLVSESKKMVGAAFQRDKSCAICHTPVVEDPLLKIKAWMSHEFQ